MDATAGILPAPFRAELSNMVARAGVIPMAGRLGLAPRCWDNCGVPGVATARRSNALVRTVGLLSMPTLPPGPEPEGTIRNWLKGPLNIGESVVNTILSPGAG